VIVADPEFSVTDAAAALNPGAEPDENVKAQDPLV
jgi:hypothetical protein